MLDYTQATIDRVTKEKSTQCIFDYYACRLEQVYDDLTKELLTGEKSKLDISNDEVRNIMSCLEHLNLQK